MQVDSLRKSEVMDDGMKINLICIVPITFSGDFLNISIDMYEPIECPTWREISN